MEQREAELLPGRTYHVFNRVIEEGLLFRSMENHRFFLRKYQHYICPIAKTMAFCLMPAHFHFLVQMREEKELIEVLERRGASPGRVPNPSRAFPAKALATWPLFLSKQFSNFFNAYTQAFNKVHGRKGNLMMRSFKKKEVRTEVYFRKLIHYIHMNPVKAGYCDRPEEWTFSSFEWLAGSESCQSSEPWQDFSFLEKDRVLSSFGDQANFIRVHREPPALTGIDGSGHG